MAPIRHPRLRLGGEPWRSAACIWSDWGCLIKSERRGNLRMWEGSGPHEQGPGGDILGAQFFEVIMCVGSIVTTPRIG